MDAAAHYDAVAAAAGASAGAGRRTDLQRFHNAAKRALLAAFAGGAGRVLDLACGRGGDVRKWNDLGVRHVTGVDASARSLEEAERRARAAALPGLTRAFVHADLTAVADAGGWGGGAGGAGGSFDAVTCMFALHYFFGSERCARELVRAVADSLRPGGYFVGIVPDALEVNERIRYGAYEDDVSRIEALWPGAPACFGSAYTFAVRDTVVAEPGAEAVEYLVYGSVLAELAAAHGLEPAWRDGDPGLAVCFDHAAREHLRRLRPPAAWAPDGGAARCSRAYAAFAFRKR